MPQEPQESKAHFGWDKGLEYNTEKDRLTELVRKTRDRPDKAIYSVLLIQIVNGSRINEAVQAALLWAENGNREQRVRVQKLKDRYMRLMIIPKAVRDFKSIRGTLQTMSKEYKNPTGVIKEACRRKLSYNTHALRYAFISDASRTKPLQIIAKITGQKSMNTVLQ